MRTKTMSIKAVEGTDGGSIVAYAATFDREPDYYGDVVAPGAFVDAIKSWTGGVAISRCMTAPRLIRLLASG